MPSQDAPKSPYRLQLAIGIGLAGALAGGLYLGTRNAEVAPPQAGESTVVDAAGDAPLEPMRTVGTSPALQHQQPASPRLTLATPPDSRPAPRPAATSADTPPPSMAELSARLEGLASSKANTRFRDLTELGEQLSREITPEQLADWLTPIAELSARRALVKGFLSGLAAASPEAAMTLAMEIETALPTSGMKNSEAIYAVASDWAVANPTATADFLEGVSDANLRRAGMRGLASRWARDDPGAALAWAFGQDQQERHLIGQIAQVYGHKNAEAAVAQLFELETGPAKDAYLAGIAATWVTLDPETAMAAISTIDDRNQRVGAIHQAVVRWAHRDPASAATWAATQAEASLRDSLRNNIARTWSSRDPEAALAWAAAQTDLDTREALVAAAAPQAVWRNPDLAINTVAALPDSRHKTQAINRLVTNWTQRDPAAAAAFVTDNQLAADIRQRASGEVAYNWSRRNSADAISWIGGLDSDAGRWNAVLGAAVGAAQLRDGRLISEWRQAMSRDDLGRHDVETWLNRNEIPEAVRAQLLPLVD